MTIKQLSSGDKMTPVKIVKLREKLVNSGLSQDLIAEKTGVPQSTISRFLRGATPKMIVFFKLQALKIAKKK